MIRPYLEFLLDRAAFNVDSRALADKTVNEALDMAYEDARYNYPSITFEQVQGRILANQNELPVFIYRLGNIIQKQGGDTQLIFALNSVNKVFAGCEIYFSNEIGPGFNIIHGLGTVIGSRNRIGKGFVIYQNCTLGHYNDFEKGATIGNDVTLFSGSQIIGEVTIGHGCIIGCNSFVNTHLPENSICAGSPAKVLSNDARSKLPGFRENYRINEGA